MTESNNCTGWDSHDMRPRTLVVMLTRDCNLSCSYCYIDDKNIGEIVSDLDEKVSDYVKINKSIKEIVFCGGEPLLKFETLKKIVLANNNVNFTLNTNGTLMTKEIAQFLKKNNIAVVLSLDGNKETTDSARKSKSFSVYDKIKENIKYYMDLDTIVSAVITPINCVNIKDNFLHLVQLGFRKIRFNLDVTSVWRTEDILLFKKHYQSMLKAFLTTDVELINMNRFTSSENLSNKCSQIAFSDDGKILPCRSFYRSVNISAQDRDKTLNDIKKKIKKHHKECNSCYSKQFCFCPVDVFIDSKLTQQNLTERMNTFCELSKAYIELMLEAKDALNKDDVPIQKEIHQMWFSITEDCNNRCTYCFVEKKATYMHLGIVDRALDLLIKSPGKNKKAIIFGGEPMLHFDLVTQLVRLGKRKAALANKNIEFGIGTNAVNITKEEIDFFKKENIQLSTTLDGKKETHDKYRVTKDNKPTYDTIVKNLKLIQAEVPDNLICCLFGVHYKEPDGMYDNLMHIVDDLGIQNINIEPMQNHEWSKEEIEQFKFNLVKIFNELILRIEEGKPFYINAVSRILRQHIEKENYDFPYYKNFVVFSDGRITANPFLYYIDEKYIVGDVYNGIKRECVEMSGKDLKRNQIDFDIIKVRDHFCNKIARVILEKDNSLFKEYINTAMQRLFE